MHTFKSYFRLLIGIYIVLTVMSCQKEKNITSEASETTQHDSIQSTLPKITGKVVYHSYDSYGENSKMYIYDFSANKITYISQGWNIYDPINADFSPDGTKLVFMGQATQNGKLDIYLWTVGSHNMPVNLTSTDGCRDEDPKFSPDGSKICFKQTPNDGVGNIKIMNLNGNITDNVTNNTDESGMPYFKMDGGALLYARGDGSSSDIYMVNINGSDDHPLENMRDLEEYYPIAFDSSSFLYDRWYSVSNHHDQIYKGFFNGNTPIRLAFNESTSDFSDACPCGQKYIILSCDKSGGSGAYDLYIVNVKTGDIWSLSQYNYSINTSLNELGASYH